MRTVDELEDEIKKNEAAIVEHNSFYSQPNIKNFITPELRHLIAMARAAKDARDAYLDTDEINQAVEEAIKGGLFGTPPAVTESSDRIECEELLEGERVNMRGKRK